MALERDELPGVRAEHRPEGTSFANTKMVEVGGVERSKYQVRMLNKHRAESRLMNMAESK